MKLLVNYFSISSIVNNLKLFYPWSDIVTVLLNKPINILLYGCFVYLFYIPLSLNQCKTYICVTLYSPMCLWVIKQQLQNTYVPFQNFVLRELNFCWKTTFLLLKSTSTHPGCSYHLTSARPSIAQCADGSLNNTQIITDLY